MKRRKYLATVGTISVTSVAGCGGSGSTTETEEQEEESVEDYVELVEHSFQRPPVGSSGIDLIFTVENVSDEELGRIEFDSALFVDNERVDESTATISGLGSGIQQEEDMIFNDVTLSELREVTNYTITIRLTDRDRIEETYEFDEFNYPPE